MKAIRVHQVGGPEVLRYEDVPEPKAGPNEAVVRTEAIGVNYIDVYFRTGLYKAPLPFTPGMEGAGEVTSVGAGVTEVKVGDRVAFGRSMGAYAQFAVVPAWHLVPLPGGVDARTAAASMLQGMTAHYLTHSTYPIKPGDTILVHAAAGGAGQWIVQAAKKRGARVIGTVSTEEKARLARECGADEVILYTKTDFEAAVKELTQGRGANAVYDSVGKTTWEKSLNCLARRGMLVLFGQASGPVPPIDPLLLSQHGSVFVTRASLMDYIATREDLVWRATDVLNWVSRGEVRVRVDKALPLASAAEAHRIIEGRQTTGKLLLLP